MYHISEGDEEYENSKENNKEIHVWNFSVCVRLRESDKIHDVTLLMLTVLCENLNANAFIIRRLSLSLWESTSAIGGRKRIASSVPLSLSLYCAAGNVLLFCSLVYSPGNTTVGLAMKSDPLSIPHYLTPSTQEVLKYKLRRPMVLKKVPRCIACIASKES